MDNDLRRDVAFLRNLEQQQQKRLSYFKPKDETVLETTISYEQLAVDLTANLAVNESNSYVQKQLNFALLEVNAWVRRTDSNSVPDIKITRRRVYGSTVFLSYGFTRTWLIHFVRLLPRAMEHDEGRNKRKQQSAAEQQAYARKRK